MKKIKGFTLTELIVVIAIMGILAGMLVPAWMNYILKARVDTQNNNAKIVFNAAQGVTQDYKFKERKVEVAKRELGAGEFYFYWNGTSGSIVDSAGAVAATDTDFTKDYAAAINKIFSGSKENCYKIYVKNYMVQSVVCARVNLDADVGMGSYPVEQRKRNTNGKKVTTFNMYSIDNDTTNDIPPSP